MVTNFKPTAILIFAAILIILERCEAAPAKHHDDSHSTKDSLYGDHVYSGEIIPISGAVPRKIHEGASAKPSGGLLNAVTGVLPFSLEFSVLPTSKISAHKKEAGKKSDPADVLKDIKSKVDKGDVSQLDSSIQNDLIEDKLIPQECSDKYGTRDGVLKHAIRGVRSIVTALLRDVKSFDQNDLMLLQHLIKGVTKAVTFILCGVDDAVSDIGSGLDNGLDALTKDLVHYFQGKDSTSLSKLPDTLSTVLQDIVGNGVGEGLHDLLSQVKTGVDDLTSQIAAPELGTDVSGLLTGVEKGLGV